jgi:hypothetical protein
MSDAYGSFVVSYSSDCKIEHPEMLCEALNQFVWSSDDELWEIEGGRLFYGSYGVQYPTTYPEKAVFVVLQDEEGNETRVPYDQATMEQKDDAWDIEHAIVSLGEISRILSPFINTGCLEISCVSSEKSRFISFESLSIGSDGKVVSAIESRSIWNGKQTHEERYKPELTCSVITNPPVICNLRT